MVLVSTVIVIVWDYKDTDSLIAADPIDNWIYVKLS